MEDRDRKELNVTFFEDGVRRSAMWMSQPWLQWITLCLVYVLYGCDFRWQGSQVGVCKWGTIQVDNQTKENSTW